VTAKATTKKPTPPPPAPDSELQHYGIDEAAGFLKVSKRWLAGEVAARAVPFTVVGGRTKFTAAHIRRISAMGEVDPATHGRRAAA
jgi:hypothetical protein